MTNANSPWPSDKSTLACVDSLVGLRAVRDGSVDLIYHDLPYNRQERYTVVLDGDPAQRYAHDRNWDYADNGARALDRALHLGGQNLRECLLGLQRSLGDGPLLGFLAVFALNALEYQRIMRDTASLMVHCDSTLQRYFARILESIFGAKNLREEIIVPTVPAGRAERGLRRGHETLVWVTKSDSYTWEQPTRPQDPATANGHDLMLIGGVPHRISDFSVPSPTTGPAMRFNGELLSPPKGRRWAVTDQQELDRICATGQIIRARGGKGRPRRVTPITEVAVTTLWDDIFVAPNSSARERVTGFRTQKSEALMERIIKAATKEGDVVLDPGVGSGTTVVVAQRLGRRWIGMDISGQAIEITSHRLQKNFGTIDYERVMVPEVLEDARRLAERDRFECQWWILERLGFTPDRRKGADGGKDHVEVFRTHPGGPMSRLVISVKSGRPRIDDIRSIEAVRSTLGAEIGAIVLLDEPTGPMRDFAAARGEYVSSTGERFRRLQILTVEEILAGRRVHYPRVEGINAAA